MTEDKTGRIIWHDLFTADRQDAMAFYQRVVGWTYRIEHATDFAWGHGEKDFVLAVSGDEAGAGLIETAPNLRKGWMAYVEVRDVDVTVARAEELGGKILRQPFEVPGVGRNALLRDPHGALFGISLSRHSFPAPQRQFGPEVYLSDASTMLRAFYGPLLGWTPGSARSEAHAGDAYVGPTGDVVAIHLSGKPPNGARAIWVPSLKVPSLERAIRCAEELGAERFARILFEPSEWRCLLLRDRQGALCCMQNAA